MEKNGLRQNTGKAVLLAFLTALALKGFFFDFMIAEGRSMLPVINPGTVLVVNRAAYGIRIPGAGSYLWRWALPKAGDIVIFYTPGGDTVVKRCIEVTNTQKFFALGDNLLESYDSRSYGLVPADHIIGKVIGIK
ncbi:MAG: S26 family signal peptidase [Treponema sp.]|jgi:signal peptidase I|nr:S26 family signal peptidase [Treponema sp.]